MQILQRAESDRWCESSCYNSLAVHTTVPLIVHENQRLDARLKTLAVSGGRPKFSALGHARLASRGPFELRLPPGNEEHGKQGISAWRSDVQLPLWDDPFQIPRPKAHNDTHVRDGAERSHFWL